MSAAECLGEYLGGDRSQPGRHIRQLDSIVGMVEEGKGLLRLHCISRALCELPVTVFVGL